MSRAGVGCGRKGCERGKSSGRRQNEGYGQVGNNASFPRPAGTAHNDEIVHRPRTRADTQAAITAV